MFLRRHSRGTRAQKGRRERRRRRRISDQHATDGRRLATGECFVPRLAVHHLQVRERARDGIRRGAATEALHTDADGIARIEEATAPQSTVGFFEHMIDVIRPIWKWIVFGVVASAAITVWVPPGVIAGWSNVHPALAGLAALAVALPLYVCATASVPIAAALIAQGMPTGAALVFLMAGPATNVATIGAVKRTFGGRVLAVYLGTVVIGSVGLAYLYDAFIPFEALGSLIHAHEHPWWAWASAVLL
ncbi:MAG: hypothetical protein E4H00_09385, partial [Myxococcales bacterium]